MLSPLLAAAIAASLLACNGGERDPVTPKPLGPLEVGVATLRMPVPLGIGTVGNGGFGISAEPSPFAEIYPATTRIQTHPDLRAVYLRRGDGSETAFLRIDAVGVFQQLRRAVVLELEDRLGRDMDDVLIIGASHTHSGPGRIIDGGGPFDLIADRFLPQYYEQLVSAMADAVEAAYLDLQPGRIGTALADGSIAINDRRCEDGLDYVNGTMPLVAIEQGGELAALMMAYPIHGTVLGISALTISKDVSGAIEEAVEDGFDRPVTAIMFNAWGADMSPHSPGLPAGEGATLPGGFDRMEEIGRAVSDVVQAALPELDFTDVPELWSATRRTPINRQAIGYQTGEFPFEHGGVYCSGTSDCDPSTRVDGLDQACVPFPEAFSAPTQTEFSVGRVHDLTLVTFPGEPGTLLAEKLHDELRALDPSVDRLLFLGYAQDYLGYSILEDDWWQGGYEASGALWGPRQGEFLVARATVAYGRATGLLSDAPEPQPTPPFDGTSAPAWAATDAATPIGTVLSQPEPVSFTDDVITVTVAGADPWWGAPVAMLELADGTALTRPGGQPITSDGLAMWTDLLPEPSYRSEPTAAARTFAWTFSLPASRRFNQTERLQPGIAYRLTVTLPDGDGGAITAHSEAFTVTARD